MQDENNSIEYSIWNTRIDPKHKLSKEAIQRSFKSKPKKQKDQL